MKHEAATPDVGSSTVDVQTHHHDHHGHDHVAAVFADRDHAVAAVDELRSLGLGSEHLGIAVHGDDNVAFEHDATAELLHDAEHGAAVGAPIAAIAGIGLVALAVPGIGPITVGGMLAVTGASAMWGGVLGAFLGASAGASGWIEHEDIGYTALEEGEVLVVVCGHEHADAVREIMRRHDGRLHTIEAGRS